MTTAITMTELAELILIKLYEISTAGETYRPQDINKIAASFGVFDDARIYKAANFLKNNNLIELLAISEDLTQILGYINEDGEHYLDIGGKTGIIARYKANPVTYNISKYVDQRVSISDSTLKEVNFSAHSSNVIQTINANPKIENLLNEIITNLKNDPLLSEDEKNDLLLDVESIKNELRKMNINKPAIKSKLDVLAKVSSIGSLIINFARIILG